MLTCGIDAAQHYVVQYLHMAVYSGSMHTGGEGGRDSGYVLAIFSHAH